MMDNRIVAETYTATIEVKAPEVAKTGFEVYYVLNKDADADDDKYVEYGVGDTVSADVYLVNYGMDNVLLQAYDIYLTYDSNLSYVSDDFVGTAYKADGNEAATADVVDHIQLVAEDGVKIAFPKGTAVPLGTINFTVANTAVYDTDMPITLEVGDDSEEVTNIAVGTEAQLEGGDKTSYYPKDVSEFDGVEIDTKHTVTFYDGESKLGEAEVGHNTTATAITAPEKAGYDFVGWYADKELTDEFEFTTKITTDTSVYAKYEQNTVTITWYNAAGAVIETDEVNVGSKPEFNGENPTKAADAQYTYTFKGWTTDATPELNAEVVDLTTYTVDVETKFYPVFSTTTNTYTVYWKNWNGEVLETDVNVPFGTVPEYNSAVPTKAADERYTYIFNGWSPEQSAITGETTYTAQFKPELRSYTVKFATEANGTLTNAEDQTIAYGSKITAVPTVTANAGYTFDGWYVGDEKVDLNVYIVEGEVTLTAKYTANKYTIAFDGNGAESGSVASIENVIYDQNVTISENGFVKDGFAFNGWNTMADGSGTSYTAGQSYKNLATEGTVTLYAQWKQANFDITYETAENGSVSGDTAADVGEEITLTVTPDEGYELDKIVIEDENGNEVPVDNNGTFTMPEGDVTVTVTFKPINYKVTVGTPNNGTVSIVDAKENYIVNDVVNVTASPAEGYKLSSITATTTGGAAVTVTVNGNNGTFTMPADNVTVTASFVGIEYKIQFNNNGGNGTMNDIDTKYGEQVVLTENVFTKTGYHFAGWATAADGAVVYGDKATVSNLSKDGTAVVLYAVWEANNDTQYVVKHWQQKLGEDAYDLIETETLSGTTAAEVTPAVKGYNGFVAPKTQTVTILADGSLVVDYYYDREQYDIILDDELEGVFGEGVTPPDSYIYGEEVALPTPIKPGYDFEGWLNGEEVVDKIVIGSTGDLELKASWSATPYTIIYDLGLGSWTEGNALAENKQSYTIENSVTLPSADMVEYDGYVLDAWIVEGDGDNGNWGGDGNRYEVNQTVNAGMYGNVTLKALWLRETTPEVEEYKYAQNGYVMLRVKAPSAANMEYQFDGVSMYYINDTNYNIDGTAVFYTLIPVDYYDGAGSLTDEGYALLKQKACTARKTVNYACDINQDGVVNVADANAVYQMTQFTGKYYSVGQFDTERRLSADLDKGTGRNTNEFRGSIEDVHVIINEINGVAQTNG